MPNLPVRCPSSSKTFQGHAPDLFLGRRRASMIVASTGARAQSRALSEDGIHTAKIASVSCALHRWRKLRMWSHRNLRSSPARSRQSCGIASRVEHLSHRIPMHTNLRVTVHQLQKGIGGRPPSARFRIVAGTISAKSEPGHHRIHLPGTVSRALPSSSSITKDGKGGAALASDGSWRDATSYRSCPK